jgi:hypothetical protein
MTKKEFTKACVYMTTKDKSIYTRGVLGSTKDVVLFPDVSAIMVIGNKPYNDAAHAMQLDEEQNVMPPLLSEDEGLL